MKKIFIKTIFLYLMLVNNARATTENCSRASFTHDQLNSTSGGWLKKTLAKYSDLEAVSITQLIDKKATFESGSAAYRNCRPETQSCSGQDESWTHNKDDLRDAFGNSLRFNGFIISKKYDKWPANDLYYGHGTQIGYTCAWGGNLLPYCEKWCLLTIDDERFRD